MEEKVSGEVFACFSSEFHSPPRCLPLRGRDRVLSYIYIYIYERELPSIIFSLHTQRGGDLIFKFPVRIPIEDQKSYGNLKISTAELRSLQQRLAFFFISYNCIYKYTYILRKKLKGKDYREATLSIYLYIYIYIYIYICTE